LISLYWSFATIATVGYGDIIPVNDAEVGFASFVMFVGAVSFGYIIGNVSSIIRLVVL
jgi:hypothetical protein